MNELINPIISAGTNSRNKAPLMHKSLIGFSHSKSQRSSHTLLLIFLKAIIIGILTLPSLSHAQNINHEFCYKPPIFPVRFCVDQRLSVSAQLTREWVTPIGAFGVGTKYTSQEDTYTLRIDYRDSSYIYEIDSDHKVEVYIKGESKGTYENQEAWLEVEDYSEITVVFLPKETTDPNLPNRSAWESFLKYRFGLAPDALGTQVIQKLGNPTEVINEGDDQKIYAFLNPNNQRIAAAYIDKATDKLEVLVIYSVDGTTEFFESRNFSMPPQAYFGKSVNETMDILGLLNLHEEWEVAYNAIYYNPVPCNQDDCSIAWLAFFRPYGAIRSTEIVKFELYFNGYEPSPMNSRASDR